ncbi:MAG: hypothetical protein AAF328_05600 [Planctomycetota bacterium]
MGGDRITHHADRAFGPIAGVLYSVANGDLKVGVPCVALGHTRSPHRPQAPGSRVAARLEVKDASGRWSPASQPVGIAEPDYYALIRITDYDAAQSSDFRVVLHGLSDTRNADSAEKIHEFHVPAEPTDGWDAGGGYLQSPMFVNLVQRTMCGHNPDAYDPGPLDSGVTNYFHTFSYGGVDFAVLEDRKFKSAAKEVFRQAQPPQRLGNTQRQMLEDRHTQRLSDVRIVVSQTNYANLATRADGNMTQDRDSHGWPKAARDRAVALFEKNDAILFTGDQHLASVARLETPGADGPGVMQFSQPAAGCIWWRWFHPNAQQRVDGPPEAGPPPHLGRYVDGFGNLFEILAVANPAPAEKMKDYPNPQRHRVTTDQAKNGLGTTRRLHGGEGVALIRVDQPARRITLMCWPLGADVTQGASAQFPDWPIVIDD